MERDQSQQAIPRNSRLRGDVVEAAVKSIQVAANVSDHVEEQTVPSARLQRKLPAEQEGRQADDRQHCQPQQASLHQWQRRFQGIPKYISRSLIASSSNIVFDLEQRSKADLTWILVDGKDKIVGHDDYFLSI